MADRSYLILILRERYGIVTEADLNRALAEMKRPNLGAMVSAVKTNNRKECKE